jgi:Tol biopolymer transport system component
LSTNGKIEPLPAAPSQYLAPEFSPDGRLLALEDGAGQHDILVYDIGRRSAPTRLTLEPTQDSAPVWSPSGRQIAFASQRGDKSTFNLYWQNADGTGQAHRLTDSKNRQTPASWHPTGRYLAFVEVNPQTATDIMILPLAPDGTSG